MLTAKRLDGSPYPSRIRIFSDAIYLFTTLDETKPRVLAVQYAPTDANYHCDGVIVPPVSDTSSPVIVWQSSVATPRDRCDLFPMLVEWFPDPAASTLTPSSSTIAAHAPADTVSGMKRNATPFMSALNSVHSIRRIIVVLFYNDLFGPARGSGDGAKYEQIVRLAATNNVEIVVVDETGLLPLGLNL
jgi:hypothetical protein